MNTVDVASIIQTLKAAVAGADYDAGPGIDQPTIVVPRERLLDTCGVLRTDPALGFSLLADVTAVDWWPSEPRYEVVYHLASVGAAPSRLRIKVRLGGEDAHLPTVKGLWASADWLEREVWDLFGIVFDGHGDLRRLLMPEDWEGHPLRKDYPVQIRMKPKVYEPLQMTAQEFQSKIVADRTVRGGSGER